MKILYCYVTAETEGSKIHIDSFISAFKALGEDIVDAGVVTQAFKGNKNEWSLGKKIWAKLLWLRLNLVMLLRVFRKARQAKAEILVFRFMPNHQFFLPICILSFFYPVVLELNAVRSIEDPTRANWLNNLLDRLTLMRVKRSFVVSRILKKHVMEKFHLDNEKIAVIENGVDVEVFESGTLSAQIKSSLGLDGRFVVGFVGSFKPWHGTENIIALAEEIRSVCLDIAFLIVGDGKERQAYEKQIASKGLRDYFTFTGYVPHEQVRNFLSIMDVALSPHQSDSFKNSGGFHGSPLKIFEYMAMSKAIIATPIGQIKEVIIDGDSGRLINAENTKALTDEVIKMRADSAYRKKLGVNACKRVKTYYTWKVNAEKVRNLCREALEHNG